MAVPHEFMLGARVIADAPDVLDPDNAGLDRKPLRQQLRHPCLRPPSEEDMGSIRLSQAVYFGNKTFPQLACLFLPVASDWLCAAALRSQVDPVRRIRHDCINTLRRARRHNLQAVALVQRPVGHAITPTRSKGEPGARGPGLSVGR